MVLLNENNVLVFGKTFWLIFFVILSDLSKSTISPHTHTHTHTYIYINEDRLKGYKPRPEFVFAFTFNLCTQRN